MNQEIFFEVCDLQENYVQAIDNDRLEEWPEFFVEECRYKIIPRENLDENLPATLLNCDSKGMLVDRVVSYRHANVFNVHYTRHVVGMPRIISVDDSIRAQTNYCVFQTQLNGVSTIFQVGTYLDEMVRVGGKLKFRSKECIADTFSVDRLLATPV